MIDRQLVGDVLLAALLAVPTAALARPDVPRIQTAAAPAKAHVPVTALATAADRQVGLFR